MYRLWQQKNQILQGENVVRHCDLSKMLGQIVQMSLEWGWLSSGTNLCAILFVTEKQESVNLLCAT